MRDLRERETNAIEKSIECLHTIPTFVTCTFLGNSLKGHRTYKGFIEDISPSELSLELRDDFVSIQESLTIYTPMEITMDFHFSDGLHEVVLTGIITWNKRVRKNEKSFLYLGMRLDEQNERSREILNHYLSSGAGDRNLIWNLWDNFFLQV